MATRKNRSRTIGRVARITRKAKPKPSKIEPSAFFDTVEDLSSPDAKVKELIKERRKEKERSKPE